MRRAPRPPPGPLPPPPGSRGPPALEAGRDRSLVRAAHDRQLELAAGGRDRVERRVERLDALDRRLAGRHDEIAGLDARRVRRAALLDGAHEQTVALRQADRGAQPARHARRRDRDAETVRRRGLSAGEQEHPLLDRHARGHREDEPAVEPQAVHAEQVAVRAGKRPARRSARQRRGVLDRAADPAAARAPEAARARRHEAERRAQAAAARVGERHDGRADRRLGAALGLPANAWRVTGVDAEHGEVEVGVRAGDRRERAPAVGEDDGDLFAPDVVRAREHVSVADHDARAVAPATAESDDGGADGFGRTLDRVLEGLDSGHMRLQRSNLRIASDYTPATISAVSAEPTSLSAALDSVGDRWTLLLVEALLGGPRRFGDLQDGLPGIAPNVLTQRLRRLEAEGLVLAQPYSERPQRYVYELTASGHELAGALRLLADWGARHRDSDEPPRHDACGTPVEARWWCPTCEEPVDDEQALGLHFA